MTDRWSNPVVAVMPTAGAAFEAEMLGIRLGGISAPKTRAVQNLLAGEETDASASMEGARLRCIRTSPNCPGVVIERDLLLLSGIFVTLPYAETQQ